MDVADEPEADAVTVAVDLAGQPVSIARRWPPLRVERLHRTGYSLLLSAAGTSAIGLAFWFLAARLYPTSTVGQNAALISAMQLIAAPAWAAQYAVMIRFVPGAGALSRGIIWRSYALAVAAAVPLAVLAAVAAPLLSPSLDVVSSSPLWLLTFVISVPLWSVFVLQDAAMTAMGQAHWVPLENIAYAIVKLGLLAALASALPATGVFAAWIVPLAVLVGVVNVLVFARLVPTHQRTSVQDPAVGRGRAVASYGAANWAGTLLTLIPVTLIPILVASELGSRQSAFFYIPWTIAIGLPLIGSSMTTAFTVEGAFARSELRGSVREAARHTALLLVPLMLVVGAGAPHILRLFGAEYADQGSDLLRLLVLSAIPVTVVQFAIGIARVRRDTRMIFVVQAVAALLAVGLSALLIDSQGIIGPGIAWLVAQSVAAILSAVWLLRTR